MSHLYSICKEMLTSSQTTSNELLTICSTALFRVTMFTLLHLLIYSPLICVALSQRKQFKANEPHPQRPLVYGVSINLILI